MKTLIGIVLRLYPSEWRERYGEELRTLVEDSKPRPSTFLDLLRGGLMMRLTAPSFPRLALFLSVVGLAIATAVSFLIPNVYESRATMQLVGASDTQQELEFIEQVKAEVTSRNSLATLIQDPRLNLYARERTREPLEDVEDEMRRNTQVLIAPKQAVFTVTFRYPDQNLAHVVVQSLVTMFINAAMRARQPRRLELLDPPSLPEKPISPNRAMIAATGFIGGLLLASVLSLFGRRPQYRESARGPSFPKLALLLSFGGLVIGTAASFLVPNVYRATAVLRVSGLTDGQTVQLIEKFRAEMLSRSSLAAMMSDPRLNLYSRERARQPLEDVVDKLRSNIQIERPAMKPVIFISFDYREPAKTQATVMALAAGFINAGIGFVAEPTYLIDMIDMPVRPYKPIYPNRALIAAIGFAAGFLLAAAISIFRRRPQSGAFTTGQTSEA